MSLTMCGIGLGATCYCQAYRDGVARGEPGVPGVGEDILGVKPLASKGRRLCAAKTTRSDRTRR